MTQECLKNLQVHPEFCEFQNCVKNESVIEFTGFIGEKDDSNVRLYPRFDLTQFFDIPKSDILYVKKIPDDPDERVKLFVRDEANVKSCSVTDSLQPVLVSRSLQSTSSPECFGIAHTIGYLESLDQTPPVLAALNALRVHRDLVCT